MSTKRIVQKQATVLLTNGLTVKRNVFMHFGYQCIKHANRICIVGRSQWPRANAITEYKHDFHATDQILSIDEVKRINKESEHYFFSPDTMRFFNSRICGELYNNRYFVTSERQTDSFKHVLKPRTYTIQEFNFDTGDVRGACVELPKPWVVTDETERKYYSGYSSAREAKRVIRELLKDCQ